MPKDIKSFVVFVASANDVKEERDRLGDVINQLNLCLLRSHFIQYEFIRWETHVRPGFHTKSAQEVVNKQIPPDYDVFIGIMWHRFGTPTAEYESGTEEEFSLAKKRWDKDPRQIRLMMYFKDKGPKNLSDVRPEQFAKVLAFKESLSKQGGLYKEFESIESFERMVRLDLHSLADELVADARSSVDKSTGVDDVEKRADTELPDGDAAHPEIADLMAEAEDYARQALKAAEGMSRASIMWKAKLECSRNRLIVLSIGLAPMSSKIKELRKISKDIDKYADQVGNVVPVLRRCLEAALTAFAGALGLVRSEERGSFGKEMVEGWAAQLGAARSQIAALAADARTLRDGLEAVPGLSSTFKKAKRNLVSRLDDKVNLFDGVVEHIDSINAEARRYVEPI
jgi:Domain of unknown function (DUF4062)